MNSLQVLLIIFILLFQVVMSPHEQPQGFVDNYIRLLSDSDINEFQKVLEMKVRYILYIFSDPQKQP